MIASPTHSYKSSIKTTGDYGLDSTNRYLNHTPTTSRLFTARKFRKCDSTAVLSHSSWTICRLPQVVLSTSESPKAERELTNPLIIPEKHDHGKTGNMLVDIISLPTTRQTPLSKLLWLVEPESGIDRPVIVYTRQCLETARCRGHGVTVALHARIGTSAGGTYN